MTNEEQAIIEEILGNYPLCEYFFLPRTELTLSPAVKELCAADAAVYGERRHVPPALQSYEKCVAELEQYSDALLFDAVYEVADAYDLERCAEARVAHGQTVRNIADEMEAHFGKVLPLSISCDLCEDCPCPKGRCKLPEKKIASMDSYGVQIMKTLADRDIMYDYGIDTAIYFTLILFNGANE